MYIMHKTYDFWSYGNNYIVVIIKTYDYFSVLLIHLLMVEAFVVKHV